MMVCEVYVTSYEIVINLVDTDTDNLLCPIIILHLNDCPQVSH